MMVMRISTVLAVASVALVVLIDLATGQGPPIYTNYMQAQQDFRPPPPPMHPVAHVLPANYPPNPEMEKQYKKAIELGEKELKEEKKFEKELGKESDKKEHGDKYGDETTPAPGVLSSFSNSMNNAWKSVTALGRNKRATSEEQSKSNASSARSIEAKSDVPATAERALDSYEYLQHKNQGYVYFKVPKYLVCNY